MDTIYHTMPLPGKTGTSLLATFCLFQYLGTMTHEAINLWIATITGACALGRYIYFFLKWLRKRK